MKQGAKLTRGIILMMLLALIAYGIAAAFSALEKSTATVTAIAYEVGDGFQSTGFVARDEQVLKAPDGINVLLRDEGERVAKGEALAATFADEDAQETQRHIDELELELSRIESVLGTLSTTQGNAALDSQLQQALVDFTAQIVRGNLASAGQNANSLKATVLRRFLDEDGRTAMREQAQSLRGELASLRSRLAGAVTQSVAQRAGFFSGTTDGYERILTVQTVSNISVSDYDEITRMKPEAPSGTLGRLITSPQWYYVCEVSRADLAGCKVGDWLSVEFAFDVYEPLRMRVERISDPVEERQILVLSCEDHMEEAARLRTQQADIILHSYQGVRVPKQAIYFDNDTGTAGVYVLVGAMARWKSVEIIYEAQDYYLVRQDNSNTSNLWAGDEIILTKQEITDGKVME